MPIIKKAQVLIITVFAIISTSIIVFALLLPILGQLKSWQETTETYQALASAEAGLELEILNQNMATDTVSDSLSNVMMNSCSFRRSFDQGQSVGMSENCQRGKIHFNLKISTSSVGESTILRIDSEGISGRYNRTLFLISY